MPSIHLVRLETASHEIQLQTPEYLHFLMLYCASCAFFCEIPVKDRGLELTVNIFCSIHPLLSWYKCGVSVTGSKLVRLHLTRAIGKILFSKGSLFVISLSHYIDVIMTTIASQITSLAIVYSTVDSDADQRKHQSSASLAFVRGIHRDRWIPRTKGQLRGKCFHLMTSSCHVEHW